MNTTAASRLSSYFTTPQKNLMPQLYLLLSTAIEMLGADKGNIQFFDKRRNVLKIIVQIGFQDEFLRNFSSVIPGDASWGAAFRSKQRVIIHHVDTDPGFSHLSAMFKNHGYVAVQSTPLLDKDGRVFGILSTHFRQPIHLDEQALAVFDAYLKQAVPIILRRHNAVKTVLNSDELFLGQKIFPFLQDIS